jgi:hypothetical protein
MITCNNFVRYECYILRRNLNNKNAAPLITYNHFVQYKCYISEPNLNNLSSWSLATWKWFQFHYDRSQLHSGEKFTKIAERCCVAIALLVRQQSPAPIPLCDGQAQADFFFESYQYVVFSVTCIMYLVYLEDVSQRRK